MREVYIKERNVKEKSNKERELELLKSILSTKEELKQLNENFQYADKEMIDYYTYELKANQSKLDYLIKFAKKNGISLDMIEAVKIKLYMQNDEVV